jgi:prepilin peptidase CpaA
MALFSISSYFVLVMTAATLFYVAMTDLQEFKIRNDVVLALAGLFLLYAILSGRWTTIHWNMGLAVVTFATMLYYYHQGLMGGGDVKLLAVAFLWVGVTGAVPFAILLVAFILLHLFATRLGWARYKEAANGRRIPLGPSVAGALIGVVMSGWLGPVA